MIDALSAKLTAANQRAEMLADSVAKACRERNEWKEAAQRHHPNPVDYRYWEGRYRDEKARAATTHAEGKAEGLREAAAWIESVPQSLPNRQEYAKAIRALIPAPTPACDTKTAENVTLEAGVVQCPECKRRMDWHIANFKDQVAGGRDA